jgi:hypothetical protein
MQLIGLSGKAGVGKDWVAQQLLVPQGFRPWSLAWHFKTWVVGRGLATYDEVFHTKPPAVRHLLQQAGTEEGRAVYGEDIWCATAAAWLQVMAEHWDQQGIVVPDIRFPNEVAFIERLGGHVIRVAAPGRAAASPLTAAARAHVSETAVDDYPFVDVLHNDPDASPTPEAQMHALFDRWGWTYHDWQRDQWRAEWGIIG